MSYQLMKQVDHAFPGLLRDNTGHTCFRFIQIAKAMLERAGHRVQYVAKTNLDHGQHMPAGFGQHLIVGRDGKTYTCTGVSHDVLYIDDEQRDLIISGNYYNDPIFDGQNKRISAAPKYGEPIPHHEWRPWNPALPLELEVKLPQLPANIQLPAIVEPAAPGTNTAFRMPDYATLGDDRFFVDKVGAFVAEEMGRPVCNNCGSHDISGGMNAGSASWIARTVHSVMNAFIKHSDHRDADAIVKRHRNEMRAVLKRDPIP